MRGGNGAREEDFKGEGEFGVEVEEVDLSEEQEPLVA